MANYNYKLSLAVSKEGKLAKIRSGFEKDLQHSRARPSLEFKAGITNLGNGTRIGFYPRAFAERETNFLKKLQVLSVKQIVNGNVLDRLHQPAPIIALFYTSKTRRLSSELLEEIKAAIARGYYTIQRGPSVHKSAAPRCRMR